MSKEIKQTVVSRRLPHGVCCHPKDINHALCHKHEHTQWLQINDIYRRLAALENKDPETVTPRPDPNGGVICNCGYTVERVVNLISSKFISIVDYNSGAFFDYISDWFTFDCSCEFEPGLDEEDIKLVISNTFLSMVEKNNEQIYNYIGGYISECKCDVEQITSNVFNVVSSNFCSMLGDHSSCIYNYISGYISECKCSEDWIISVISNNFESFISQNRTTIFNYLSADIENLISDYIDKYVSKCYCTDKPITCELCSYCSALESRIYVLEQLLSVPQPTNVETVTLSLATPYGVSTVPDSTSLSLRSTDDAYACNTVAFDSLLADVAVYTSGQLNTYYYDVISPVISINDYNLLSPIPVTALCDCVRSPYSQITGTTVKWEELDGYSNGDEMKRAYIMQFILANRSNQTRAIYLTNQLTGSITLPIIDQAQSEES